MASIWSSLQQAASILGWSLTTHGHARRQERFGPQWRSWSALWWTTLVIAAISPSALASLVSFSLSHVEGVSALLGAFMPHPFHGVEA